MEEPPAGATQVEGRGWQCPGCGEAVPAGFDVCWSCGCVPDQGAEARVVAPAEPEAGEGLVAERAEAIDRVIPPLPRVEASRRGAVAIELLAVALVAVWPRMYPGLWAWFAAPEPAASTGDWSGTSWWGLVDQDLFWAGLVVLVAVLLRGERGYRLGLPCAPVREVGAVAALVAAAWVVEALVTGFCAGLDLLPTAAVDPTAGDHAGPEADQLGMWLHLPLWLLIAAAMEEFVFRVYLWHRLVGLFGRPVLAILVCSALFAAAHGGDSFATISHFAFAVLLGLAYWRWRSAVRVTLAHFGYNLSLYLI